MDVKKESNLTLCKTCKQLKNRILVGKFDDKNKKYVDDNGKLWNGKNCAECTKERARTSMQKLRKNKNESK